MAIKSNITLKIDAEDGDAVKSFLKLTQAERNLEMQTKRSNKAMKEKELQSRRSSEGMLSLGKSAGKAILAIGGITGVAGAFALVTREVERMDQALIDSAKRANEQSRGLREFAALQAAGPEGQKFMRETLIKGAARGLMPDQTAQIAQPIQSLADKDGDGKLSAEERKQFDTDFDAAAGLAEASVAPEDALRVITAGRARGQSGQESADLLIRAAETSAQGPATFARSISATGEFSDQKEALSILSALTKEQTDTGKLPAAMERLGLVLGKVGETGETAKFTKKFSLEGLSETEKIAKLREYGAQHGEGETEEERVRDFTSKLPSEKGLSKEQAIDLARVVRQASSATATRGILERDAEGRLDSALKKGMDDPLIAAGVLQDRQKALTATTGLIGPQAEDAKKRLAKRQIAGAERLEAGDVDAVTETGELKAFGDLPFMQKIGRVLESNQSAGFGYGAGPGAAAVEQQSREQAAAPRATNEGVQQKHAELIEALRANTEATLGNSKATAGKAPAGGAASNAEEAR